MLRESGIYKIKNIITYDFYVGSAVNLHRRWGQHLRDLIANRHDNDHLQNAWNKYGTDNFEFSIIELCEKEILLVREQFYIDSEPLSYNICPVAGSSLGFKFSDESRAKISRARMGMCPTDVTRAKLSKAHKGNKYCLGYKHTEETRAKMSIAQKNRPPISDVFRAKLSTAQKGHLVSDATRAKISAANIGKHQESLGKHHTDVTKNKISKAHIGKKREGASSKFYGVYKSSNKWEVRFSINKKVFYLGCFKSEIEAAKTYNQYVIENNLPNPLNQFSEE